MAITLAPYAEKIVSDYLREHDAIVALDGRIVGKSPSSTDDPWVRVTQLGASAVGDHRSDHLIEFYFQFDCYAGGEDALASGQPGANLLARTLRAVLVEMPQHSHDAVVSRVVINGMSRIPDVEIDEPARERFVLTVSIWMHN